MMTNKIVVTAYQSYLTDLLLVSIQKRYFIFSTFFVRKDDKYILNEDKSWQVMSKIAFNKLLRKAENQTWEPIESVPKDVMDELTNWETYGKDLCYVRLESK